MKYINVKFTKRMASYRLEVSKENTRALTSFLLPVSFGVSSVTLLYLLDQRLSQQPARLAGTGIRLHIVTIDSSAVEPSLPISELIECLRQRFPRHEYSVIPLADLFERGDISDASPGSEATNDSALTQDAQISKGAKLERFISSLPSATSRTDIVRILKTNLLVQTAKSLGCKGILWGDTTTKLAERTLAETAKGRGFSIPWQISDGESPFGMAFYYPLRDLLRKELVTFSERLAPPLTPLIAASNRPRENESAPTKNTSIDGLLGQYFASVEENFPNIVANVVRTSDKLSAPAHNHEDTSCSLCGCYVTDYGEQSSVVANIPLGQIELLKLAGGNDGAVQFCHGCRVSLSM
jgi:cytoplasmic tRNA 2-thiolation protein 2